MELKVYPDPVLRKRALPLRRLTDAEVGKLEAMLDLMYRSQGIGLAGPQVGWNARVLTMDVDGQAEERIFINPQIIRSEGIQEDEEGCLSVPGLRCSIARAEKIFVVAYNIRGIKLELEAEGLEARAWQHEIDHLNGVLFIDKVSPADSMAVRQHLKSSREHA